jgi:hypothetical protein
MKNLLHCITASSLLSGVGFAEDVSYLNTIRQFQEPSKVQWDASTTVASASVGDGINSELEINPGGANFELWTLKSSSEAQPVEYLLSSSYVGAYIPIVTLQVTTEDTAAPVLRTRADRPFWVNVKTEGLLSGESDPEASKSVQFLRHVQSYGVNGTGENLDRDKATALPMSLAPMPDGIINKNGDLPLTFPASLIPGEDLSKIRGEVTFTLKTQVDDRNGYHIDEKTLASQIIQIWPVADGKISGVTNNQAIRFSLPTVTIGLNDLYPGSTTYAQVYKGGPSLGTVGKVVPGSAFVNTEGIPQNKVLTLTEYDTVFDSDGRWTMEVLTSTPFGVDRLDYVSFDVNRTIKVNAGVTTIDKK